MGYKIEQIEGIGAVYAEKLQAAGVKTTEDLLEKCAAKKGRVALAEETGISEKLILKWTIMQTSSVSMVLPVSLPNCWKLLVLTPLRNSVTAFLQTFMQK